MTARTPSEIAADAVRMWHQDSPAHLTPRERARLEGIIADAIERGVFSAAPVADGWKLVPIEPSAEMQRAVFIFPRGKRLFLDEKLKQEVVGVDTCIAIYRAMLAAAPSPPPAPRSETEG